MSHKSLSIHLLSEVATSQHSVFPRFVQLNTDHHHSTLSLSAAIFVSFTIFTAFLFSRAAVLSTASGAFRATVLWIFAAHGLTLWATRAGGRATGVRF